MFRELQQRRAREAETETTILILIISFIGMTLEV